MKTKFGIPIAVVGTTDAFPSIEYSTGFKAPDPVVFVRNGAARHLVVPQMEFGRACRGGVPVQVFTPEALGLEGPARARLKDWLLSLLRRLKIKSIIVPPFFPFGVAEYLERHAIRIKIADSDLFPERAVKRPDEVQKIRESQQAAVIAIRAAIARISSTEIDSGGRLRFHGKIVTSEYIRDLIARVLFDQNCIGRDIIVAGGAQAADPHEIGSGPLKAGEAVVMDIFPKNMTHGYWGDLTRTVVKGSASPFMKRVYHAVKAAQVAALGKVKAGINCASVHQAAVDEFSKRGLFSSISNGRGTGFIHGTGHGVGLSIHEAPSISTAKGRLKAGNVITIEPGLYYPGVGGVRIEDTIVVTSSGWRYLVPCEKRFEV